MQINSKRGLLFYKIGSQQKHDLQLHSFNRQRRMRAGETFLKAIQRQNVFIYKNVIHNLFSFFRNVTLSHPLNKIHKESKPKKAFRPHKSRVSENKYEKKKKKKQSTTKKYAHTKNGVILPNIIRNQTS